MMKSRAMPFGLGLLLASSLGAYVAGCGGDDSGSDTVKDGGPGGSDAATDSPVSANDAGPGEGGGIVVAAPGPTRGSAIALSADDSTLVVANRDSGSVTVFTVAYNGGSPPTLTKKAEVPVGAEPWQVAISSDGKTAYAVLRKDQKLVEITGLTGTPAKGRTVATGSEPTAVALSPTSKTAWVANWVDGTVMGFDTATMTLKSTVDLNATLATSGMLGAGVTPRASLAHPRSIAITNNGDLSDDDETMLVTEYYAQRKDELLADFSNADTAKQGVVYKVKLSDKTASVITLAPIANISATVAGAGCYPNQLQSVTISGTIAYVTSVCASPNGPLNPVADTHGAVSTIDLAAGAEVATGSASLMQKFEEFYTTNTFADDATRRYPSVPSDLALVSGKSVAYVAANAADGVFRVSYDGAGVISAVGTDKARPFIDVLNGKGAQLDAAHQGKNPIGIVTPNGAANAQFAFVMNDISRNVTVIDFQAQDVAGIAAADGGVGSGVFAASAPPTAGSPEAKVVTGRRLFNTGTARWSKNGQAWQACQSCHMDGLSDNITWEFNRGPRQSVSLDGTFSKSDPTNQRILNWTGIFDEVADFEGNVRNVSGGKGATTDSTDTPIAPNNATNNFGLEGSSAAMADPANPQGLPVAGSRPDWANITAYVQQIRSPKRPANLDVAAATAGKALFTTNRCQGCHGGDDKWTVSKRFYAPTTANSDALTAKAYAVPGAAIFPTEFDPATNHTLRAGTSGTNDVLQCALRNVGTFNLSDGFMGIAELKSGGAPAQGGLADGTTDMNGYNVPSLLGMSVGAPYYHAGQVATLEGTFATDFAKHHATIDPNFLLAGDANRAVLVNQLVQYVLSIDASEPVQALPGSGFLSQGLCPTTFP